MNHFLELVFSNYQFLLELHGRGAILPEGIWLVLLTMYLVKETRRRGLGWYDWLHLPPGMNFILAIYICDLGVVIQSIGFSLWQWWMLVVGGALVVVGFLCKIRALTVEDLGNRIWLWSGGAALLLFLLLVTVRWL